MEPYKDTPISLDCIRFVSRLTDSTSSQSCLRSSKKSNKGIGTSKTVVRVYTCFYSQRISVIGIKQVEVREADMMDIITNCVLWTNYL